MGYQPAVKNTTPTSFLPSPLLNLQTVQAPSSRHPPLYISFSWISLKNQIFQEAPKIPKFLSLTPYHLLKVGKFLVKISPFKFLIMTEKNVFVYKLFLSLIFHILVYFLFYFYKCNLPPWKKLPLSLWETPF